MQAPAEPEWNHRDECQQAALDKSSTTTTKRSVHTTKTERIAPLRACASADVHPVHYFDPPPRRLSGSKVSESSTRDAHQAVSVNDEEDETDDDTTTTADEQESPSAKGADKRSTHHKRQRLPHVVVLTHTCLVDDEDELAAPIAMDARFNGTAVKAVLVDNGASRSVARRSALNRDGVDTSTEEQVDSMSILSSSGHLVPISARLLTNITTADGYEFSRSYIYIVDDTEERDIVVDYVLGRNTLGTSPYLLDVSGQPRLVHKDNSNKGEEHRRYVQCYNAQVRRSTVTNAMHLRPLSASPSSTRRQQKHEERLHEQQRSEREYRTKLATLSCIVSKLTHYTPDEQEYLLAHMVTHVDDYGELHPDKVKSSEQRYEEALLYADEKHIDIVRFFALLDKTPRGTPAEQQVISNFFSAYIPESVKHDKKDAMMEEVESIDFPYTPPRRREVTPEYLEEKRQAIKAVIDTNVLLKPEQKKRLHTLIIANMDRLSMSGENLTQAHGVDHEIDTGDKPPFRERLRVYSPAIQALIDKEVSQLVADGVVVPSRSPYASNLLMVRKPDPSSPGGVKNRLCVSYVRLNDQTVKDSYPIANLAYILNRVGLSTYFTTMDLLNGFWQVAIKKEHRHKTAFITMRGLFEFVVMPFGLCNAPATFQRLMDAVIEPEYRDFIETYVDDVCVHSKTFDEHCAHLEKAFELLRKHNLVVKLSKCKFAQLEVKFLGHIISYGQVRTNPEVLTAVQRWQRPSGTGKQAVKAVRSFLGLVGWYRKFIPRFADLARPLIDLTKKDVEFKWTQECQHAFEALRDALISAPVLAVADPNKSYIVDTDANDDNMSCVIMQEDTDGQLHPIAFASKRFTSAQRNYDTTEREALAIPWTLQHFNSLCEGHKFTLFTDHKALAYLKENKDVNKRIHRLALKMMPYHVDVYWTKGIDNHGADLLSRADVMMDQADEATLPPPPARPIDTITKQQARQKRTTASNQATARSEARAGDHAPHAHQHAPSARTSTLTAAASTTRRSTASRRTGSRKASAREHDDRYEVDRVISKRPVPGKSHEYEYEVTWKGYDATHNTWQSLDDLSEALDAVIKYERDIARSRQRAKRKEKEEQRQDQNRHESEHAQQEYKCSTCRETFSNRTHMAVHLSRKHHGALPDWVFEHLDDDIVSNRAVFAEMQRTDKTLTFIYDSELGAREPATLTTDERKALRSHDFVLSDDGLLYCVDVPSLRSKLQPALKLKLVVPKSQRQRILSMTHDANHFGVSHTQQSLTDKVWWPHMLRHTVKYVSECERCQTYKGRKPTIPAQPMALPTYVWQQVEMDFVGPLTETSNGNKYILTIYDRFSKYGIARATKDNTSETAAECLVDYLLHVWGYPEVIITDRGGHFVSELQQHLYRELKIKRVKTTAYNPPANGGVERFNGTLKSLLTLFSDEYQTNWDTVLQQVLFEYNTTPTSATGVSPYYVNHGRNPRSTLDALSYEADDNNDVHEYVKVLRHKLVRVHERVRALLKATHDQRQHDSDISNMHVYEPGERVFIYTSTTPAGTSPKMRKPWHGPYTVLSQHGATTYNVLVKDKQELITARRLKPYNSDKTTEEQLVDEADEEAQQEIDALQRRLVTLQKQQVAMQQTSTMSTFLLTPEELRWLW